MIGIAIEEIRFMRIQVNGKLYCYSVWIFGDARFMRFFGF